MQDNDLNKLIGKKVKVDYLVWGELGSCEGILEKVSKWSIVVSGKRINKRGMDIKEIK